MFAGPAERGREQPVLRGVTAGKVLEPGGRVLRRGRRLLSGALEARVEDRQAAATRVTKPVVRE
ncbi:MAG TPA: hypothetical protein VFA95_03550 [Gammaproteobacteria bacterium]|nr:hypothetical protein [Gammaproteobacteria bacterium]